jgi:hypothetical protein
MAEFKETHTVTTTNANGRSSATPWLAFLVGALLIASIAIFFLNIQGSFSGPGGSGEITIKSPLVAPANPAK